MVTLHLKPTSSSFSLLDCVFKMEMVLTLHKVLRYVHGRVCTMLVTVSRPALLDNTLSISKFFNEA